MIDDLTGTVAAGINVASPIGSSVVAGRQLSSSCGALAVSDDDGHGNGARVEVTK